MQKYNSYL